MKGGGIYEIVNLQNGKRYIGSAKSFAVRWRMHLRALQTDKHRNRHLQAAWNKYGENAFAFRVLVICAPEFLIDAEQTAINGERPEYNISPTAGSTLGLKFSDETKRKISEALKGKTLGRKRKPQSVALTAAAHRGMKRSEETCRRISEALAGRKRDPAQVEATAAKLRGRKLPPERFAHLIGNKHSVGRKDTEEQRAAKSARQIGRLCPKSAEHRAKLSASLKGIPHSPERRQKQADAQRGLKRGPYRKRAIGQEQEIHA